MDLSDRRERFRKLLRGPDCVPIASVFDPISARIAEDLDYKLGILAGSVASMAVLGAPDLIVLSLSELAALTHRICRAANLPVFVDADHGYGNALNVRRTVEELETAGAAALSIEDTILPTPFGEIGKVRISSIEEGIGRMRAAVDARHDKKLAIVGRTSAPAVTNLDDAIARGKAYVEAGVDAMVFIGVKTRAQLDRIADAVKVPLILGASEPELQDRAYMASRGVRMLNRGHQPFPAAVQAVYETMKAMRDDVPHAASTTLASSELMARVTRAEQYDAWQRAFLGG